MPPQGPSPALFFDTISAYQRTEALRAAIELDLFSLVAAGRQTATELADACQAAPRGIRILADYLTIIGFLHKHGDRYELTADAKVFLDRESPAYLGGAVSFMLAPGLRESFQQLTAAVRRGGTAVSDEGTVSHDNPIWVEFARAMAPLMQMPAQLLAGLVGGDTGQPLRVLDVAAGHGLFGITIADHYRQAHVTAAGLAKCAGGRSGECSSGRCCRAAYVASRECLRRCLGRPVRHRATDKLSASLRRADL